MTKQETERLVKVETKIDYMQEDIAEIKAILKEIKCDRDDEVARLKEIEETISPFTNMRRRIWAGLVGILIAGALEIAILIYYFKELR